MPNEKWNAISNTYRMRIYNGSGGRWRNSKIWVKFDNVGRLPYLTLPKEPYLTTREACLYLNVSETTFYRSVNEYLSRDETGLFDRDDLDEYLYMHNPDRYRLIMSVREDTRKTLELLPYKPALDTARAIAVMYGEDFLLSLIRNGYIGTEGHDIRAMELSAPSLGLTHRARNCMRGLGITHVYELECLTEEDLWGYRNMGEKSFNEIKAFMLKHGLKFKASHSSHEG